MNLKPSLLILSSLIAFTTYGQAKVKKQTSINKITDTKEVYYTIKEGEHQGKKHGTYTFKQRSNSTTGHYAFGKKEGLWYISKGNNTITGKYAGGKKDSAWVHHNKVENELKTLYFSMGHLDSTEGYSSSIRYRLHYDKEGDTSMYQAQYDNGYFVKRTGDTTVMSHDSNATRVVSINGKREGKYRQEVNGLKSEGQCHNNESIGTWTSYYESGNIMCQKTYGDSSELDGNYIVFFENGDTALFSQYSGDRRHGLQRSWYENGQLLYKALCNKNRLMEYTEYSDDGIESKLSAVKDGKGTFIYKSSKTTTEIALENGIKHGISKSITPDSTYRTEYKNGIAQGEEDTNDTSYVYLDLKTSKGWTNNAEFNGGEYGLQVFLAETVNYPTPAMDNDVSGKVTVQFVIDDFGNATDLKTLSDKLGFGLEEESIRAVKASSYLWTPATYYGFPVSMRYRIPVRYQLY